MARRGYGTALRWTAVGALVVVLAALPALIGALPASDAAVSAAALRTRVLTSAGVAFSGYAESAGGLSLPVTDQLTSVANLFSERSTMRVWWRGPADNRVDVVTASGETGTHTGPGTTWTWDYDRATATRTTGTPLALPAPPDLLPSAIGRRLVSEATAAELSRLPARRIAGRDAPGLRLTPADKQTTINRVDVWADPDTGVPLRVEVGGVGLALPVVAATYLDFSSDRPSAALTGYDPPTGLGIKVEGGNDDLAARIDSFASVEPPRTLAGYPVRERLEGLGAIGTYGNGVTVLTAVPLPGRIAGPLGETLAKTPGVLDDPGTPTQGTLDTPDGQVTVFGPGVRTLLITVGPVSLLEVFVSGDDGPAWLLTGTVTADVLRRAGTELTGVPIPLRRR